MSPTSAVLSPLADPFYPSKQTTINASSSDYRPFSVLYCDGIPMGVVNEHEAIANIADEIIDELFPPTALDAAEMDAVDDFLNVMVNLSLIEEREEKCRLDLGLLASKRWEAKRKDGLRGRPHLSSGRVERVDHASNSFNLVNEQNIIPHSRYLHSKRHIMGTSSHKHSKSNGFNGKKCAFAHRHTKSIQQPRKQN